MNVLAIADPQIMISAPSHQPAKLERQFFVGGASRHEQDSIVRPAFENAKVFQDLFGIEYGTDDELELVLASSHQRFHDGRGISPLLMISNPLRGCIADRRRVAQLGADRPQVANAISVDSSSGFDRDVFALSIQLRAQFGEFLKYHRLATGDHHVLDSPIADPIQDGTDCERLSLGVPGRIPGVAEPATQIASAGTDENTRRAGEDAFPLDAAENLGDSNHNQFLRSRSFQVESGKRLLRLSRSVKICELLRRAKRRFPASTIAMAGCVARQTRSALDL